MILLYFLLYAAAGAHLYHFYPLLPEKLATQFGNSGQPVRWMGRDGFALFYIGLLFFTSGVFLVFSQLLGKIPDRFMNLPNKQYWLAPERREQTVRIYARDLGLIGLFVGGFIIGMHHMLIGMALEKTPKLDLPVFLAWVGVFLAGIAFFIIRQYMRFRKPDDVK